MLAVSRIWGLSISLLHNAEYWNLPRLLIKFNVINQILFHTILPRFLVSRNFYGFQNQISNKLDSKLKQLIFENFLNFWIFGIIHWYVSCHNHVTLSQLIWLFDWIYQNIRTSGYINIRKYLKLHIIVLKCLSLTSTLSF